MKKEIMYRICHKVISTLLITVTLFSCHPKKYSNNSPISLVPPSSPLFVKINDFASFTESLNNQNNWWDLLSNIKNVKPINNAIATIDSVMNINPEFRNFIKGKEVVISFFPSGDKPLELLIIIPVDASGEQKKAEYFIAGFIRKEQFSIVKKRFDRENLYEIKSSGNKTEFCYTINNGYLIIGKKPSTIEEAINHFEAKRDKTDDELAPLLKTTNNQAQLNIFINHHLAQEIFSSPLSEKMNVVNEKQKDYSGWSELDATFKEEKIIISGFTNADPAQNCFSTILQNQKPGISKIESVLPSNTAFFSSYYISDADKFFTDLNSFQSLKGSLSTRLDQQKQIEDKTGFNLQKLFIEIFDGEVAKSGFCSNVPEQFSNSIFTIKTKSGSFTLDKLLKLIKPYQNENSSHSNELIKEYKIDNQTTYKIYKFPFSNFTSLLFGDMFGNVETSWFTVYNNYLIFADSYSVLGKIILSNMLGETLMSDGDYNKFQIGLSSKNNYFFYCNTSICYEHANLFFNDPISKDISTNEEFRKFRHFSWQISSAGNMIYNNSTIVFDQSCKFKPQTVWQSHLAGPLAFKPFIREDKYDSQNNEIVLIDTKNNLYLLNNIGRILWQINTGSPILGEINLVDLYDNGDHQFVFNTREQLYIVDKKGNAIKNFPLNFKVPASNGISVFDYENTHNYRFFFSGEDQMIYAYEQDGEPLEGWQSNRTDHLVTKPLQHFFVEGKDYIVASDRMKDYIFDRKGNTRVKTDYVYQHSKNNSLFLEKRTSQHDPRLVNTDSEGNIHRTYFNGNHETIGFNQLDDTHYFLSANADDDEELEYIFTGGDHIYVQKNGGRSLFNLKMDEKILEHPCVYNFSSKVKKIGVTSPISNKIYLFDSNGSLYKGFPLDGCTAFNIVFMGNDKSRFNLFVGSPDGFLYNYLVE